MFGMYDPLTLPLLSEPQVCRPLLASCSRCETQRRREVIVTELCFYLQGSSVSGGGETLLAVRARGSGAAAVMVTDEHP